MWKRKQEEYARATRELVNRLVEEFSKWDQLKGEPLRKLLKIKKLLEEDEE